MAAVEPQFWLIKSFAQLISIHTDSSCRHSVSQCVHVCVCVRMCMCVCLSPKAGNTFHALDKWLFKNAWNTSSQWIVAVPAGRGEEVDEGRRRAYVCVCAGQRINYLLATPTFSTNKRREYAPALAWLGKRLESDLQLPVNLSPVGNIPSVKYIYVYLYTKRSGNVLCCFIFSYACRNKDF